MAPARKRSRKKPARAKKKAARRGAPKRSAAKRKTARRSAAKKTKKRKAPAKRSATARRKASPKKSPAPKRSAPPPLISLAQKIIRMTQGPSFGAAEIRELYQPDARSIEASGATAQGHAGLEEKMKGWEQMTAGMDSAPRNVWTGPHTICIEWDSTVTMRDGRTVRLHEVAVHEIKDGKIQSERYYYDPSALAPPAPPSSLPPPAPPGSLPPTA